MASGHVNRASRPNTRLHRPICYVKKALANSEPSTHGALRTWILEARSRWANSGRANAEAAFFVAQGPPLPMNSLGERRRRVLGKSGIDLG
jgi:hypothetical protein